MIFPTLNDSADRPSIPTTPHADPLRPTHFKTRPRRTGLPGRRQGLIKRIACLAVCVLGVSVAAGAETDRPAEATGSGTVPEVDLSRQDLEAGYQFALGKWLADRSKFEEALEAYEKAMELAPDDVYGWIEVAKLHSYLAQISRTRQQQVTYYESSLSYLQEAKTLAPDNLDVLALYAETHMRLGNEKPSSIALALGAYEQLNQLDPGNPSTLTALGQIYLWNRDGEKAVEVLSEAARFNSSNRIIQSMLVEALLGTGKKENAEEALRRLIPLEPGNPEHRLRLAELLSDRGDHAGAVEVLEGAPEEDWLSGARVRRLLAREYHLAGRHEDALKALDAEGTSQTGWSQTGASMEGQRRLRAAVLSALLRYEEAIEAFSPLVGNTAEGERQVQDAMLLSRLYERVGRYDEAVATLRSVDVEGSAETQVLMATAGALERAGEPEEALAVLAAVNRSPDLDARSRAVAAQGRVEILTQMGRVDEASEALGRLAGGLAEEGSDDLALAVRLRRVMLEVDQERWSRAGELLENLGDVSGLERGVHQLRLDILVGNGQVDEALDLLRSEKGMLEPRQLAAKEAEILFGAGREAEGEALIAGLVTEDDPETTFFASQLYQRHERYAAAAGLLETLVLERPDNVQALFALGASQERAGEIALSTETFQRLLSLSPKHAPTLNYLGYMWADRGENLDQALEMIHDAVSQDPDNGAYVDSLGWVYYRLGQFDEALEHLEWASKLEPDDPTVFSHLGDAHVALGQNEPARKAYERALELTGEDETAEIEAKLQALDEATSSSAEAEARETATGTSGI